MSSQVSDERLPILPATHKLTALDGAHVFVHLDSHGRAWLAPDAVAGADPDFRPVPFALYEVREGVWYRGDHRFAGQVKALGRGEQLEKRAVDAAAHLDELMAAVPVRPLVEAQGFSSAPFGLSDGTMLFNRAPDQADAWNGEPRGDYLAVRFDELGVPLCKQITHADARRIQQGQVGRPREYGLAFDDFSDTAEPLHRFVTRDGLLEGRELERELSAWAAWGQDPGLPRLRGILERRQLGAVEPADELMAATEFAAQLRGLGFTPHVDLQGHPAWGRAVGTPAQQLVAWRITETGEPRWQEFDGRLFYDGPVQYRDLHGQEQDGSALAKLSNHLDRPGRGVDEGGRATAVRVAAGMALGATGPASAEQPREGAPEAARLPQLEHAGIITWGPERSVTNEGRTLHRLVLWNTHGQGSPTVVIFDAPFSSGIDRLRPGDFISVTGLARPSQSQGLPWNSWATAVTVPGWDRPLAPGLISPPPPDPTVGEAFGLPIRHQPQSRLSVSHNTFAQAMTEPPVIVATSLDEAQLVQAMGVYAKTRGLSSGTADAVRFAFDKSPATLPASIAADLQGWSTGAGHAHSFTFETPAIALQRQYRSLPEVDVRPFERLGIAPSTLGAAPFRSALRCDAQGCVALSADERGPRSIVRAAFDSPGRADVISGAAPGLWITPTSGDSCSQLIITQSPITALAHYQQNPDDNVRYIAVGGDRMTDEQKATLRQFLTAASSFNGERPEIVVTAHHKANGIHLFRQVQDLCPEFSVEGVLPKHSLGRDWVEAARNAHEPEKRVDLPAYAASRLGYEELYRSPDNRKAMMGLRSNNVPQEPISHRRLNERTWLVQSAPARDEKLLFTRQNDGSWRYENDRSNPNDRGSAADLARSRLQLSLADFRSDLRRFDLEQDLKRAPAIDPDAPDLGRRGIYPETVTGPCFKGTLRVEAGRLVYAHQDHRGVCGVEHAALSTDDPLGRAQETSGARGLWMSNPYPNRAAVQKLVVVDSPLTALAYHQQNPAEHVRYIATSGTAISAEQQASLRLVVDGATRANHDRVPELVVATSRDRSGQEFAQAVGEACPAHTFRRHVPTFGHDWPESVARREREFIRTVRGPERPRSVGQAI